MEDNIDEFAESPERRDDFPEDYKMTSIAEFQTYTLTYT